MDKKNLVLSAVVSLVVVLIIAPLFKGTVERVVGAQPGPDFLNPVVFEESVTFSPPYTATTTNIGTAATLTQNDLISTGYFGVTLGGADEADFTYTFPASTTLTNFLPDVGSKKTISFFNVSSSTSEHVLIFAAGTGIDLEFASSSVAGTQPSPLGVEDGDTARFEFERQPTLSGTPGDITARVYFGEDVD